MQVIRTASLVIGLACLALVRMPGTAVAADVDELLGRAAKQAAEPVTAAEPLMAYA